MYELRLFVHAVDDTAALVLTFNADNDTEALSVMDVFDRHQKTYERCALFRVEGKSGRWWMSALTTREEADNA